MKTLRKNWTSFASVLALAGIMFCAVYACLTAWGQTAPGLSISMASSNLVSLTVTNGSSNGLYQIYFTEGLDPDTLNWTLLTNGGTGQTNFSALMGDFEQGYFKAVDNTNFVVPSIVVIIQSPLNGSTLY